MSKKVSSTCALLRPRAESSSSKTRYSFPCPTAEAACSSSIARGRTPSSINRIPRAIAPEVTSTTSRPAARSSAVCPATPARTSSRTSPRASATMLEPSLITTVPAIWLRRLGAERRPGVELEHRAPDLHVVAGLEAGRLEPPEHAQGPQPLLDVGERLGVVDVVALEEPFDAPVAHV